MKIGIDLDHTASEAPALFSLLTNALIAAEHEVHIITYREDRERIQEELNELKIAYTAIHLPNENVNPAEWKADLAVKLGLYAMFEDSPENLSRMPSGVKRFWLCDPSVFNLDICVNALRAETRIKTIK